MAKLEVDVIYEVAMTSTPSVLMAELCDLLYNQCIDNTCCYSFFSSPEPKLLSEFIVCAGIRRPSVCRRPSSTFSNNISSEAMKLILTIFHL